MPQDYHRPPQHQPRPGSHDEMYSEPQVRPRHSGSGRLKDQVAFITGGDSGIGQAVAVAFANEGADVAIVYLSEAENDDARTAQKLVEEYGRRCLLLGRDVPLGRAGQPNEVAPAYVFLAPTTPRTSPAR